MKPHAWLQEKRAKLELFQTLASLYSTPAVGEQGGQPTYDIYIYIYTCIHIFEEVYEVEKKWCFYISSSRRAAALGVFTSNQNKPTVFNAQGYTQS